MKISEVISGKPVHDVVTISPEATVRDLIALLSQHNIGAVVVSTNGASVDGIVSERDVVRQLAEDEGLLTSPVTSIMTAKVETAAPDDDLESTRRTMTEHRFRHLPVVREGQLVGIISIGDVVKSAISEIEFERDQLNSYVHQS